MKVLLWLLAIVAAAVAISLAAGHNDGYIVLVYPPYRVDLSLNFFVVLAIMAFGALYAILRFVARAIRLPRYVRDFREKRQREKARDTMLEALQAFFEGRYGKAEKAALAAEESGEAPALNALLAARAAHAMKAFSRRDEHLLQAAQLREDLTIARLMTEAELLLDQHRYREALVVLKALERESSKHTAALRLELKAQQQAQNWEQVLSLVAQLERRDAIDSAQAEQFKIHAHVENLRQKTEIAALREYWGKVFAAERTQSKIAHAAAQAFMLCGDRQTACEIISAALDKTWDGDLLRLFGRCASADELKQIERAESWLAEHPRDAGLLLALGRLCARQELWGKAQSYLEASLSIERSSETHLALAQLLERLNRVDDAYRHYRESLVLAEGNQSLSAKNTLHSTREQPAYYRLPPW